MNYTQDQSMQQQQESINKSRDTSNIKQAQSSISSVKSKMKKGLIKSKIFSKIKKIKKDSQQEQVLDNFNLSLNLILLVLFILMVLVDGLSGTFYGSFLIIKLLISLYQGKPFNDLQNEYYFLRIMLYTTLVTVFSEILFEKKENFPLIEEYQLLYQGYAQNYYWLRISIVLIQLFLLILILKSLSYQPKLDGIKMDFLIDYYKKQYDIKNADFWRKVKLFIIDNYFGLIFFIAFHWVTIIPSLVFIGVIAILLIGSLITSNEERTFIVYIINQIGWNFLIIFQVINIPQLISYNNEVLFKVLGLQKLVKIDSDEDQIIQGLIERGLFIVQYLSELIIILWMAVSSKRIDYIQKELNNDNYGSSNNIIEDDKDEKDKKKKKEKKKRIRNLRNQKKKISFFQKKELLLQKLLHAVIVHFDKLVIFTKYMISLDQIDVIHFTLLVFFIYFCLKPQKEYQNWWIYTFIYCVSIFTVGYILNILQFSDLIPDQYIDFFKFVGFLKTQQEFNESNPFFSLYKINKTQHIQEDFVLLATLIYFQLNFIMKRQTYQQHIEIYENIYNSELTEEVRINNFKRLDGITKFFFEMSVWICFLIMFFFAFMPPINIFNIFYILIIEVVIFVFLQKYDSQNERKKIKNILIVTGFTFSFLMIIRYIFMIQQLFIYIEKQWLTREFLQDLGLSFQHNKLKLHINSFGLFAQFSSINFVFSEFYVLFQNNKKKLNQIESDNFKNNLNHVKVSYFFYRLKVLILLTLHKTIAIFILLSVFLLMFFTNQGTLFGFIGIFILMVGTLLQHQDNFKNTFIPAYVITFFIILSSYILQFQQIKPYLTKDEIKWIGCGQFQEVEFWVWVLGGFLIQCLCTCEVFLQQWYEQIEWDTYNQYIIPNLKDLKDNFKKIKNKVIEDDKEKNEDINNLNDQEIKIKEEKKEDSDTDNEFISSEFDENYISPDKKQQYVDYLYWQPYNKSIQQLDSIQNFFINYGFELGISVLVYATFIKKSVEAILFFIFAVILAYLSYYIRNFELNKVRLLQIMWKVSYFITFIIIIIKYFIWLDYPESWNVRYHFYDQDFGCNKEGIYVGENYETGDNDYINCINDWRSFLTLGNMNLYNIQIDIFSFWLFILFDRCFDDIIANKGLIRSHKNIHSMDKKDFTFQQNNTFSNSMLFMYFCHFHQFALIAFFFIGVFKGSIHLMYADIISAMYIFISIQTVFSSNQRKIKKEKLMQKLFYFNNIVIFVLCLYQAPFIQCPVNYPKDRYYIESKECLKLQKTQNWDQIYDDIDDETITDGQRIYIFMSHFLGLNKYVLTESFLEYVSKEFIMAVFFFLALIQISLWDHPYHIHYVTGYLEKRQQQDKKLRAIKAVEDYHLNRIWNCMQIQTQKDVYDHIQLRLQKKVISWDKAMDGQTNVDDQKINQKNDQNKQENADESSQLINENKENILDHEEQQDINEIELPESLYQQAERLVFNQKNGCILEIKEVINLVKSKYNVQTFNKQMIYQIHILQLQKTIKILQNYIYEIDVINLKDSMSSRVYYINEQIEKLKQYILKKEKEMEQNQLKHQLPDQQTIITNDIMQLQKDDLYDNIDSLSSGQQDDDIYSQDQDQQISQENQTVIEKFHQFFNSIRKTIIEILIFLIDDNVLIQEKKQEKVSLGTALLMFLEKNFKFLLFGLLILNICSNGDIISIIYIFSYLLYGLIEHPFTPGKFYTYLLIYTILIITFKFLYQLPIFCGSPPYSIFLYEECNTEDQNIENLLYRIDFIIGIRKYQGPSSYPKNQGLLIGIMYDYIIFLALLFQRHLLNISGKNDYITVQYSKRYLPQYKFHRGQGQYEFSDDSQISNDIQHDNDDNNENENENEDNNDPHDDNDQNNIMDSQQNMLDDIDDQTDNQNMQGTDQFIDHNRKQQMQEEKGSKKILIKSFFYRLFPVYIKEDKNKYTNINLITKSKNYHDMQKPGKDYSAFLFFFQLCIFIYTLVYFKVMTRKSLDTTNQDQRYSNEMIGLLLITLGIIILDRILYKLYKDPHQRVNKNKSTIGQHVPLIKFVLYIIQVILIHQYIIFELPFRTLTQFVRSKYLIYYYLQWIGYFFFCALQLKCGYPNYMKNKFTYSPDALNYSFYMIYKNVPFLYETQSIIDWTFTTTALSLKQWLKLEDIYGNLYENKVLMSDRKDEHKFGQQRTFLQKLIFGCSLSFLLIFTLLFPILVFSNWNPTSEISNIYGGIIEIDMSLKSSTSELNFQIFHGQFLEVEDMQQQEFQNLQNSFFGIEQEWFKRLTLVKVDIYSDTQFKLSDHHFNVVKEILQSEDGKMELKQSWSLKRQIPEDKDTVTGFKQVKMDRRFKKNLIEFLNDDDRPDIEFEPVELFPMFMYISTGVKTYERHFEPKKPYIPMSQSVNVTLSLAQQDTELFWVIKRAETQYFDEIIDYQPEIDPRVAFIALNEMAVSPFLAYLTNSISVLGLYIALIFTVGQLVRGVLNKISQRVIYEELPNTDELFDLCESIYACRIQMDTVQEEIYYELLIKIYRSPELLRRLTGNSLYQNDIDQHHYNQQQLQQ